MKQLNGEVKNEEKMEKEKKVKRKKGKARMEILCKRKKNNLEERNKWERKREEMGNAKQN